MPHVQILTATPEHVEQLLPHVRQADKDEFYAAARMDALQVMEQGLRISTRAWAGVVNGEVITIFGVAPGSLLSGYGIPWLVSTDQVQRHQKTFLRHCRPMLAEMLTSYPRLENYVDQRNVAAKAWLHWLGFKLEDPVPYGALRLPFHRFHMEK